MTLFHLKSPQESLGRVIFKREKELSLHDAKKLNVRLRISECYRLVHQAKQYVIVVKSVRRKQVSCNRNAKLILLIDFPHRTDID